MIFPYFPARKECSFVNKHLLSDFFFLLLHELLQLPLHSRINAAMWRKWNFEAVLYSDVQVLQ